MAVGIGAPLLGEALHDGSLDELFRRACALVETVAR
jgi:hypothetical protein